MTGAAAVVTHQEWVHKIRAGGLHLMVEIFPAAGLHLTVAVHPATGAAADLNPMQAAPAAEDLHPMAVLPVTAATALPVAVIHPLTEAAGLHQQMAAALRQKNHPQVPNQNQEQAHVPKQAVAKNKQYNRPGSQVLVYLFLLLNYISNLFYEKSNKIK